MYVYSTNGDGSLCQLFKAKMPVYMINEAYLKSIGFAKQDSPAERNEIVYRYNRPGRYAGGVELIFEKEFGVLSVEEFCLNKRNGIEYHAYTIVGKFRINSDEDLAFIFAKNIRLNYLFNIDGRRV